MTSTGFLESMEEFNCTEPSGGILEQRVSRKLGRRTPKKNKLVNIYVIVLILTIFISY